MKSSMYKLIVLLCLATVGVNAQKTPAEAHKKFPFLKPEFAKLEHFGDSIPAHSFFKAWENIVFCNKGKIQIAHFGGSHVQAGSMALQLRQNLNQQNPNAYGAPGFIFPFNLAKTNNPASYRVESTAIWTSTRAAKPSDQDSWGLGAMAVKTTEEEGSIRIFPRISDSLWNITRVSVFLPIGDSTYTLFPDSTLQVIEKQFDSTTSLLTWKLSQPVREVKMHWKKTDSLQRIIYLDGFILDNDYPGIRYHALGANGNSTESLLRSDRAFQQLPALAPDAAIFGIGVNDAHKSQQAFSKYAYKNNYRVLLDSLRVINPKMLFIFVTNNDTYYQKQSNPNAKVVQKAMRELAEEYGGYVFDLFEFMGGSNASAVWKQHGLGQRDHIHFTAQGYMLQADMMYYAIKQEFFEFLRNRYAKN